MLRKEYESKSKTSGFFRRCTAKPICEGLTSALRSRIISVAQMFAEKQMIPVIRSDHAKLKLQTYLSMVCKHIDKVATHPLIIACVPRLKMMPPTPAAALENP